MPGSIFPTDDVRLDNPVYTALSGTQSRFAQRSGRVLRYEPDVSPFLALPCDAPDDPSGAPDGDWRDVIELVGPGGIVATACDGSLLPDVLKVLQSFELVQMIGENVVGVHDPEAVTLGSADVPEMTRLVQLTEPGPFLERTIELGEYIGIRHEGALVAMAGERMRFDGWTEISAVCTVPTHRGQGLASRLVSTLVAHVHQRREHVFLHVLTANTNAIRLYEELGFRARQTRTISVLMHAP